MEASDHRILVCIPAYNEARNITEVIRKAKSYCHDVIVCDDGSMDDTAKVAEAAGAIVIRHPSNKGYGSAIKTLFNAARERSADIMITLDSDGQHNPDQISGIVKPILSNQADIVIGSRFLTKVDQKKVPIYRTIGIKAITKLTQIVSYNDITDAQSGFRAYNKNALSLIELSEEGMAVSAEILVRAKNLRLRIEEVPVTITYDVEDASTHNPISHGLGVVSAIVKFVSIKHPLAFYGLPGLAFIALAAVFAGDVYSFFTNKEIIPTNILILTIGSALIGLVLIATGIILYCLAENRKNRQ